MLDGLKDFSSYSKFDVPLREDQLAASYVSPAPESPWMLGSDVTEVMEVMENVGASIVEEPRRGID